MAVLDRDWFIASQVQILGWKGRAVLDAQCRAELAFWIDNLRSINGAPMRVQGMVKDLSSRDLVSDVGSMLVCVTEFVGGIEDVSKRMQEPLSEDDLGESSTFWELRALEMALVVKGESLRGQSVRWVGDSQSAVTILKVGSMKPSCASLGPCACI